MISNLKLSVIVPTYQQEKYIRQCIQSIQSQNTKFDFEILVGDDCSTDGTVEIVREITSYDNRVKLFRWDNNEGGLKNINKLLQRANGEYLTILEGDDFWLDSLHLQKSVDFLDSHKDYVFTCANYSHLINGKLEILQKLNAKKMKILSFWHLAIGNFIQMGTLVYRRKYYEKVPNSYLALPLGDYPMILSLLNNGKGAYLDHVSMAYRVHSEGIWSMQTSKIQASKTIETLNTLVERGGVKLHRRFLLLTYKNRLEFKIDNKYKYLKFIYYLTFILLYNIRKITF